MAGDSADFTVRLIDKASGPAKNINKSLGGVNDAMGGMSSGAAGISGLGGALGVVAVAATAVAAAVGAVAVQFGSAVVKSAMFAQESKLALGNLLHNGESVEEQFSEITKLAAGMGLEVQGTTKQFQKLLAAQFTTEQSKQLIKMSADLRGVGASAENVQSVLTAMTQIKSKGRLQGEELLQLQEAGVSGELVFQALEKSLGKNRAEIQKLMQSGKIDASTGLNAIGEAVKKKTGIKEFGELGQKFADQTLTGMAGKLKGQMELLFIKAGEKVLPVLEKTLGPIAKDIMAAFDSPEAAMVIDAIGDGFSLVAEALKIAWPIAKEFFKGFGSEMKAIIPILKKAGTEILAAFGDGDSKKGMEEVIRLAGLLGRGFAHFVAITGVVIGILVAVGVAFAGAAVKMVEWASELADRIGEAIFGTISLLNFMVNQIEFLNSPMNAAGRTMGTGLTDGLLLGINAGTPSVLTAARALASGVSGAIQGNLGIHSPSKEMAWMGKMTGLGMEKGISGSAPGVESAMTDMASPRIPAPTFEPMGAASGGGTVNNVTGGSPTVNVNVSANSNANPNEIAVAVDDKLRSLFEQQAIAWGV